MAFNPGLSCDKAGFSFPIREYPGLSVYLQQFHIRR